METQFNISNMLKSGTIQNDMDYERALIADRNLRILAKENSHFKKLRLELRDLIETYEIKHWSKESEIDERKLRESDVAETVAELERIFLENRKLLIKNRLQKIGLSQQEFGTILGHNSKTYISELVNGMSPFTLKDLVVIHRLLKIDLGDLLPTFLPQKERKKIKSSIKKLNNPHLKLSTKDFELA